MLHARGLKTFEDPLELAQPLQLYARKATTVLPMRVSHVAGFLPVEDQDPFGTCVAFGTGALFEYWMGKKSPIPEHRISKRAIFSMARHKFDSTSKADDGLSIYQGLWALERAFVNERDWPYEHTSFRALLNIVPQSVMKSTFRIAAYERVPHDLESIKSALVERGPLVIGLNFYDKWDDVKAPCILETPKERDPYGGHCMVIVGYDDHRKCLHIRNSWSTKWGDAGYCWMPYTFENSGGWPQQVYAANVGGNR